MDRSWYKRGVIYELHVRGYQDSNGDGTGDFRGLTSRLDYLRDLGVTAIWLLPFYPSPLKDDGYDIANYCGVHPTYGTLFDFKIFLREAHRRGLRVITELVLNHTSDAHMWFQRARRSPPGSKFRDFYVWSDTPNKYRGTRIIFKDSEPSNWTWDPLAKAHYWHRFYAHQPDLNFDHPAVHEEITKVVDFWLDLGVDGFRLDAVPYLYEREGTSCENLPETHQYLRDLRRHVDEKYGDRVLLAEANQWPDDAVAYFGAGKGDECHMAFHFPLMPRLFMSLRMEDRVPIVDILQQTPAIPETAQWALFLRNHDELTLEMVTDEERDYMYRMYAHVHHARLNLGIRRRLAPLVGNDRRRIELLTALLFSLPGTPVIYYGDEIGMGENIYLGDRNGVRTPMQWSADKNAGFSRANPQSLFLPINLDPENHYEAVNVEVQERNAYSLLWWMRRLIALYKRAKAFGMGTAQFLEPENRAIFACVRRYEDETILVVANLSRFVQPVELDLAAYQSLVPVEMFGRAQFPAITSQPYALTLGPHAFFWLALEPKPSPQVETSGVPAGPEARTILELDQKWDEIFSDRQQIRVEQALASWLPSRRWFRGKARTIKGAHLEEAIPIEMESGTTYLAFVRVEYVQAEAEIYVLPLAAAFGNETDQICKDWAPLVIARLSVAEGKQNGVLYDALASKDFCRALLKLISARRKASGRRGDLEGSHTAIFRRSRIQGAGLLEPSIARTEHSNSAIIFGDQFFMKFLRRLEPGMSPELDIGRFLTAQKTPHIPPLAGALEYVSPGAETSTVALLTSFVPKAKNAWDYTLEMLSKFYERVQSLSPPRAATVPTVSLAKQSIAGLSAETRGLLDTYVENAQVLGERTGAMYLALASDPDNWNFAPEPFTPHAQRALFQSWRNLTRENFLLLNRRLKRLAPEEQTRAQVVLGREAEVLKRFRAIYEHKLDATRIRHHGDYHLGQILYTGKDFLIIDFEGEPAAPIGERRLKRSPMEDVAGMIWSFRYAAAVALAEMSKRGTLPKGQGSSMQAWSQVWAHWAGALFFHAYCQATKTAPFLPSNDTDRQLMMDVFLLRKAVYELGYELNNRPEWISVSLQGILDLLNMESK